MLITYDGSVTLYLFLLNKCEPIPERCNMEGPVFTLEMLSRANADTNHPTRTYVPILMEAWFALSQAYTLRETLLSPLLYKGCDVI